MAEPLHESGAPLWGVAAEFDTEEALLAALQALQDRGLERLEAFSPTPVWGAAETLQLRTQPIYPFALLGAALGAAVMFGMCSYATMVSYRFNIGGRPFFSWPAYIVPSVSFAALVGALAVVAAMLAFSRLPRLNHPAFNIPNFTRVTEQGFFVAVESRSDDFDLTVAERVLAGLAMQPRNVHRVPR